MRGTTKWSWREMRLTLRPISNYLMARPSSDQFGIIFAFLVLFVSGR